MLSTEKTCQSRGCEEEIYSCEAMLKAERKCNRKLGNKANMSIYKILYSQIENHIYGL